jgi:hypothetical protein
MEVMTMMDFPALQGIVIGHGAVMSEHELLILA